MDALAPLHERPGLPVYDLPPELEGLYGGPIGFSHPRVVSNFVSSLDGVVSISSIRNAASFISGKSEHDRFVMGLLRACAGAVLIGANTLRAEPEHRWTPGHIFPDLAEGFGTLRARLGLAPDPELVVVTGSGALDPRIPALEGAVIVTLPEGEREIRRRGVPARDVLVAGEGDQLDVAAALDAVRSRGHSVVLSEAGPTVTAALIRRGLLDELFLTLSPIVLGKGERDERQALADGDDLLTAGPPTAELLSIRRGHDHLFLRYALGANHAEA